MYANNCNNQGSTSVNGICKMVKNLQYCMFVFLVSVPFTWKIQEIVIRDQWCHFVSKYE